MINLIFLGDSCDSALAGTTYHVLAKDFQVACNCTTGTNNHCKTLDFLILDCKQLSYENKGRTIFLCKNNFSEKTKYSSFKHIGENNTIGVVQSDNLPAAETLSRWKIPVISCGMSITDTITLSSIGPDDAVVCLQRCIPTLNGTIIEPFEIPIKLSRPIDSYALMCIVSIVLLADKADILDTLFL